MSYSYQSFTGDGVRRAWTFTLTGPDSGYFRESDLQVTVAGVQSRFTLTSANTFILPETPEAGVDVTIRRVMDPSQPYADFRTGSQFTPTLLNNSFLYLLYLMQQVSDGFLGDGNTYRIRNDTVMTQDLDVQGDTTVQDLLVEGFSEFMKQVDFNGISPTGVPETQEPRNAVPYSQLLALSNKVQQLTKSFGSINDGTARPFTYLAKGGETSVDTGLKFNTAYLSLNGVVQSYRESSPTYRVAEGQYLVFPEPLEEGDELFAILGGGPTYTPVPAEYQVRRYYYLAGGGETEVTPDVDTDNLWVILNGVYQYTGGPSPAYQINGGVIVFSEALEPGDALEVVSFSGG